MVKYQNTPTEDFTFSMCFKYYQRFNRERVYNHKYGSILRDKNKDVVLDIGCGFGSEFIYIMKEWYPEISRIILLDANPAVFKREIPPFDHPSKSEDQIDNYHNIKKYFETFSLEGFLKITGDVSDLPLDSNSVDIIHQNFMFSDNEELEKDSPKIINEMYRALKKNGIYLYRENTSLDEFPPTKKYGFKILKKAQINLFDYTVCQKI